MKVFEVNITIKVVDFFKQNLKKNDLIKVNQLLKEFCGISEFFDNQNEISELIKILNIEQNIISEPDRAEYGDFQTPKNLSDLTCKLLQTKNINPQIVIEPTCGKGSFILSVLEHFPQIEKIFGIEIYPKYVWETKFSILNHFLINSQKQKPEILIINKNIFDFDFQEISKQHKEKNILVIGNPPWVTNSKLSSLNSLNLPQKSNFKNHNGFDAITGKGNFDIAEYIALMILNNFSNHNGHFAFLQKNSVTKNIVFDQLKNKYSIANIEKFNFDAKKEFSVATDASLFYCKLNQKHSTICNEYDLYEPTQLKYQLGWFKDKFVANLTSYSELHEFDGICPNVWRQGIKHDCSKIMELEKINGQNINKYVNQNNEQFEIENDLVYCILKSSDLKTGIINQSRKYTIVTQTKIGENTDFIEKDLPKTYQYLNSKIEFFNNRKSSIYNNKPKFSIFGVGDYSFKKYKVAISGFYKSTEFSLLLPNNEKPIQLDDTCYFIGFDKIEYAVYTYIILNHKITQEFLNSIIFFDSKRPITKDILMRIDLLKIADKIEFTGVSEFYNKELNQLDISINEQGWIEFKKNLKNNPKIDKIDLFSTMPENIIAFSM